jgi:VWFA-related protein
MMKMMIPQRMGMRSLSETVHIHNFHNRRGRQLAWLLLPLVGLFAGTSTAISQNTPTPAGQNAPTPAIPTTTMKVNVNVVTMAVTVRDKHGAIVPNLTKDEFTLTEDGRPQTIKYFNHDTNLPLNLGLLVDTSMSQRKVLDDERTASQHFLDQMLTDAKDKAFLIQFDREVDLLEDLTPDKNKLRAAVDQLGAPQFQRGGSNDDSSGGDSGQGSSGHRYGGGTLLYDSIYLASNEVLKQPQGRKAIVLLTDGVDRGSKETINGAIEAAQRADTVVYAIYYKGEEGHSSGGSPGGYPGGHHGGGGYPGGGYPGGGYPGGGRGGQRPQQQEPHVDGKKILEQICGQTGGRVFEVTKKETADQIYTTIAEEMRSQYMLGYTPDKQSNEGGYHKIALTATKKDLVVQTREGYYSDN